MAAVVLVLAFDTLCAAALAQAATSPALDGGISAGANPDAPDRAALEATLKSLFAATLRDPANLDLTLRYAAVAARLGNFEAGATALERILFFNPESAEARLELGVLYYRMGSPTAARSYVEQALSLDLSPELRPRAQEYLSRIANELRRHHFSGEVLAGIGHQSDANLGPASSVVRVFGLDGTIAPEFMKKADEDLFAVGTLAYAYDLGTQDRDALEVSAQSYASKYFRARDFDLDYADVAAGPRIGFATSGLPGLSVKPYLAASYAQLGRDPFFHTYGGGFEIAENISEEPFVLAKFGYQHLARNFEDAPRRTTSRLLTGKEDTVVLNVALAPTASQLLTATLSFVNRDARTDFYSNIEYGGGLVYLIAFEAPAQIFPASDPWELSVAGGRLYTKYGAPDPTVDPDVTRLDRRWQFGVTGTVPVVDGIGVNLQVQREIVSSVLSNYAYNNTSVLLGLRVRF